MECLKRNIEYWENKSNFVLEGISFNCQISTILDCSFCMPSSQANLASEGIKKRDGIIEILFHQWDV